MSKLGLHLALGLCLVGLAACRDGEGEEPIEPERFDAAPSAAEETSLACPLPGPLPFALDSRGWTNATNATRASADESIEDEASDRLGSPARSATSYDEAEDSSPPTTLYRGRKARAPGGEHLHANGLAGENVSLWHYDRQKARWSALARTETDAFGAYQIALDAELEVAPGEPLYAVLEADGSCAVHYDYLLAEGARVVVTGLDGTLVSGAGVEVEPVEIRSASRTLRAWSAKGYAVVYLTSRAHARRAETRAWLEARAFPTGPVITASGPLQGDATRAFKRDWVSRMIDDFGWEVVAAYGSGDSDAGAYEDAGIPEDTTFIVSPDTGATAGSIEGRGFSSHLAEFVATYPDAPSPEAP